MPRPPLLALAATAVLLALTGCDPAGGGGGTPSPTASASASDGTTPTPTPTAPPSTADACTRDSLTSTYVEGDASAGHLHGELVVTNRLDTPCALSGYPTVFVGEPEAAGSAGAAATTDPADAGVPFDLAPGASASAALTIVQAGDVDGCDLIDTDYLGYAPPGQPFDIETTAQHVDTPPYPGCRNDDISLITVGAFHAG